LAIALIGTKDFQGTGRYLLALFPCFLVLGGYLADRPLQRRTWWSISAIALLAGAFAFGRGYYVA
jgi:dipeptide/tripeptide permease